MMTKLEELINELCPDGVEYVPIKEITEFEQPTKFIVKSTDYRDDFNTPVLTAGQTFILGYTNETDGIYNASNEHPVIIFDDFTGAFKWVDFPFKVKSSAMKIISANKDVTTLRYIYHVMGHLNFTSSEHKRLWIGIYSAFRVPLPPLSIQSEIVHILDSFTLLTAELTAELTARQKQYAFYRDYLLDFSAEDVTKKIPDIDCSNVKYVKLGDISKIVRGASPRPIKNFITTSSTGINWIKIGDVNVNSKYITKTKEKITQEGATKSRYVRKGDFILSNSMSFGRPYILEIDGCIHDGWLSISEFEKYVTADYLYYYLISNKLQKEMKQRASFGGAVQNLNADIVRDLEIAVPPFSVQENIVKILDRFDKLNNDMSEGLPAEIEARKKQYEYYRDTLLSFDNKACSHIVKVERERANTQ